MCVRDGEEGRLKKIERQEKKKLSAEAYHLNSKAIIFVLSSLSRLLLMGNAVKVIRMKEKNGVCSDADIETAAALNTGYNDT